MILHTTTGGETILHIAKIYGVSPSKIIDDNGIDPALPLLEGETLIIEGAVPRREGRYFHAERYTGAFCRKVNLGIEVEPCPRIGLKDGIMHIVLKRRKEA